MFEAFRKIINEFVDGGPPPSDYREDDYRLAAAALLVHTAAIDGSISDTERERLHAIIQHRFNLDEAETGRLVDQATEAHAQAIDLYRFTAKLNRALDDAGRARLVEMMWQIVFADGAATEFEDNLIWRAADLLNIPREQRIALRARVLDAASGGS